MTNYDHQLQLAIRKLEKKHGVQIPLATGASTITLKNGKKIWIECSNTSNLIVIHTKVKNKILCGNDQFFKQALELNANVNAMGGLWLGLENNSDSLHLCMALPKRFVDSDVLEQTIERLSSRSSDFERDLFNSAKKVVAERPVNERRLF